MTSLCAPEPVQTLYETRVVANPSTTFTTSLTTIPPELTTLTSPLCLSSLVLVNSTLCPLSTEITSVNTVRGAQVNTVQVPIVIDVTSTKVVPTSTKFRSCSLSSPSDSSLPRTPTPTPTQSVNHLPNQSLVVSSFLILSTPEPSTSVIASTTTLANGHVSVMYQTNVYSPSPTSVYVLTTSLVTGSPFNGHASLGAIVGGVIGGIAGLILIVALFLFIRRRQRRVEATFQKTWSHDDLRQQALQRSKCRTSFSSDVEPKPYQYGVIGHGSSLSSTFGQSSSTTRLLLDTSSTIPHSEILPASHSAVSQPPTRLSSVSAGTFSSVSNVEQTTMTASDHSLGPMHTKLGSETSHGAPQISLSFGDWGDIANGENTSPISVHWPRNLVVVNDDE